MSSILGGDDSSKFEVKTMSEVQRLNLYEKTLAQIRMQLRGQKLFVAFSLCDYHREKAAFSETLANVIVGSLNSTEVSGSKQYFMLKSVSLNSYKDYTTKFLCKMFEDCMNLLWPNDTSSHCEDILLLITETYDSVITQTVEKLSLKYSRMIHLPCVSRILTVVKDDIRSTYPKVETLHREMKEILVSNSAKNFYAETKLSQIPASFIAACSFYYQNFNQLKLFFLGDTKTKLGNNCLILKELFDDIAVERQLKLIDDNYSILALAKKTILKRPIVSLEVAIGAVEKLRIKMESTNKLSDDFNDVSQVLQLSNRLLFKETSGYAKLLKISKILYAQGDYVDLPNSLTKADIELFRYAPLGSLNRKRCFPEVDECIYADLAKKFTEDEVLGDRFNDPRTLYSRLKKFPVEHIDQLSVVNCFDQAKEYVKPFNMEADVDSDSSEEDEETN